jgi:hypothetical protein
LRGGVLDSKNDTARVGVYIGDFRLEGWLHVGTKAGGQKGRVSDALNGGTEFVALTEVTIRETSFVAEDAERYDIVILRKGEIKFVVPLD